ncbi:hypothetical protein WMY93_034337 [Mugilogobius chulae]|uniref:Uncharacterized protein n=1 Tax=Mugilogobius chulae TaxID=88201 RepID=A0AAW0MF55_9GOBI
MHSDPQVCFHLYQMAGSLIKEGKLGSRAAGCLDRVFIATPVKGPPAGKSRRVAFQENPQGSSTPRATSSTSSEGEEQSGSDSCGESGDDCPPSPILKTVRSRDKRAKAIDPRTYKPRDPELAGPAFPVEGSLVPHHYTLTRQGHQIDQNYGNGWVFPNQWPIEPARMEQMKASPASGQVMAYPGLTASFKNAYVAGGYDAFRGDAQKMIGWAEQNTRRASLHSPPVEQRLGDPPGGMPVAQSALDEPHHGVLQQESMFLMTGSAQREGTHLNLSTLTNREKCDLIPDKHQNETPSAYVTRILKDGTQAILLKDAAVSAMVAKRHGIRLPINQTLYDLHKGDAFSHFKDDIQEEIDRQVELFNKGEIELTHAVTMVAQKGPDDKQYVKFLSRLNFPGSCQLAADWPGLTTAERREKLEKHDIANRLAKANRQAKETVRRVSKNSADRPQSAGKMTAKKGQSQSKKKKQKASEPQQPQQQPRRSERQREKRDKRTRRDQGSSDKRQKNKDSRPPPQKEKGDKDKKSSNWIDSEKWAQMSEQEREKAKQKYRDSKNQNPQKSSEKQNPSSKKGKKEKAYSVTVHRPQDQDSD